MEQTTSKLTVFFENPFWVGVYEREFDGQYEACKITFGAEPKDYEIYAFLMKHWPTLRFSPSLEASAFGEKSMNPKRMQREIKKNLQTIGIGTKAQQALKLQHEQGKLSRTVRSRKERESEHARQFALRQEKRKEKRRGH